MTDLFPEAIQPSPYLLFKQRHGIVTGDARKESPRLEAEIRKCCDDDYFFFAYQEAGYADLDAAHDGSAVRFGRDQREAVFYLAMEFNLEGWQGVNW